MILELLVKSSDRSLTGKVRGNRYCTIVCVEGQPKMSYQNSI